MRTHAVPKGCVQARARLSEKLRKWARWKKLKWTNADDCNTFSLLQFGGTCYLAASTLVFGRTLLRYMDGPADVRDFVHHSMWNDEEKSLGIDEAADTLEFDAADMLAFDEAIDGMSESDLQDIDGSYQGSNFAGSHRDALTNEDLEDIIGSIDPAELADASVARDSCPAIPTSIKRAYTLISGEIGPHFSKPATAIFHFEPGWLKARERYETKAREKENRAISQRLDPPSSDDDEPLAQRAKRISPGGAFIGRDSGHANVALTALCVAAGMDCKLHTLGVDGFDKDVGLRRVPDKASTVVDALTTGQVGIVDVKVVNEREHVLEYEYMREFLDATFARAAFLAVIIVLRRNVNDRHAVAVFPCPGNNWVLCNTWAVRCQRLLDGLAHLRSEGYTDLTHATFLFRK